MILTRLLAGVGSGLLLAAAFPPFGWWPLAVVGVAVLTGACRGAGVRIGAAAGFVAGLVFFGILIRWLTVVGWDAWVLLTMFSALWFALVGVVTVPVTRLRAWPVWVGLVWVAQEALRDRFPLGGWPWGRLAYSQADAPWVAASWWGGPALLTFLVAAAGATLTWAIATRRGALGLAVVAGVVVTPWALGVVPAVGWSAGPSTVVAVVQGNVPATGLGFAVEGQRREVLDNHVRETLALAEAVRRGDQPQPDMVIWPENASDIDPYRAPDAAAAIDSAARAIAAPILVGAVVANPAQPDTVLNVGIVWDPVTGPGPRYVKQHPVPFGEYIPFRDVLTRFIGRFELVPRDFAPGQTPGVLPMAGVLVGDVICFEVAYDDVVRGTVAAGAQMLAVQTNNATYTGGGQSEQQVAMARLRAVETGRSTVVAATNGISAQFLPNGTELGSLPEGVSGHLVASLPTSTSLSPAVRLAGLPELAAVVALVVLLAMGVRRGSLAPRSAGNPPRGSATPDRVEEMEG